MYVCARGSICVCVCVAFDLSANLCQLCVAFACHVSLCHFHSNLTHTHGSKPRQCMCVCVCQRCLLVCEREGGRGGSDSWLSVGYAGSRLHGSLAQMRKFTCSFLSTKQTPTHTHPYTLTYSSHTHTHAVTVWSTSST